MKLKSPAAIRKRRTKNKLNMTDNTRHHLKALLFFILFVVLLGGLLVAAVLPFTIIQPQRIDHAHTPQNYKLNYIDIALLNSEKDTLKGYWTYAETEAPKGVVLLLHGIGGCKEELLPTARRLSKWGFDSVLMDSRGHGKTENGYCTYGYHETADFRLVVDEIKRQKPNAKLGLWGYSLGGAIGLQVMSNDDRIEFGIIESTFTHLKKIVYDYQSRMLEGIVLKNLSGFVLMRASRIAQFEPGKVIPVENARQITQPILVTHGTADQHISVEYGKTIFEQLGSIDKELYLVPGAAHHNLWTKGGKEYEQRLFDFLTKQ